MLREKVIVEYVQETSHYLQSYLLYNLFHYVQKSNDQLILEVKRAGLLHKSQTVEDFRLAKFDEHFDHYLAKPLHGYYERVCNTVWDCTTTFIG